MKVYEPEARTSPATIEQYGELADRGGDPRAVAQAWTDAGFDDAVTAKWLTARCFDAMAARALADMGVTPEQAAKRTRDGGDGYRDTIAYKVANGDMTARQGAARTMSSR
jgi:hypothetical protein